MYFAFVQILVQKDSNATITFLQELLNGQLFLSSMNLIVFPMGRTHDSVKPLIDN